MALEEEVAAALTRMARVRFGPDSNVLRPERLSGGASQEIWSFDVVTGGEELPLIMRRNPGGTEIREGAAGMAAEARLMRLAAEAGAPVPRVLHLLTEAEGLGAGFIMQRIDGETLAPRILREPRYAAARPHLARQLGAAAAQVHSIEVESAGDLRVAGVERSVLDAEEQYHAQGIVRPVFAWAIRWLRDHRPEDHDGHTVVHGDLRNGNIVVGSDGLRALLDWEVVHFGDPMEDLGLACVTSWRFGEVDNPVGGFGTREAFFSGYEAAGGRAVDPERVMFWEVLGTLRWGLTCDMLALEHQRGDASVEKAAIGRRASETELDLLSILAPRDGWRHA